MVFPVRKALHCVGLCVVLGTGWLNGLHGQGSGVLTRVREHVAVLCSDSLAGRGYTRQGHVRAAHYLRDQFRRLGLVAPPALPDYLQPFRFDVNVVEEADVRVGTQALQLGVDFLPASVSGSGEVSSGLRQLMRPGSPFAVVHDTAQGARGRSLQTVLDSVLARPGIQAAIVVQHRLTHSFAEKSVGKPVVVVTQRTWTSWQAQPRGILRVRVVAGVQNILTQNVVGYLPGSRVASDTLQVVCAHYDHLGQIGTTIFRGANDNASGTALLLALADTLARNRPPYNTLFIAFSGEEAGLHGSFHFVRKPIVDLTKVRAVYNFDLLGTGTQGIMAVGGVDYPELYAPLDSLNRARNLVPGVARRKNAPNSDHYPFTQVGIPALFIYTQGGSACYHDPCDRPENLHFEALPGLLDLFVERLHDAGN
jgi:hypothetical protein